MNRMPGKSVVFVVDRADDVAILAPIARLSLRLHGEAPAILRSDAFLARDGSRAAGHALDALCSELGITPFAFADPEAGAAALNGRRGMVLSASESTRPEHARVHRLFQSIADGWLKVAVHPPFDANAPFWSAGRPDGTAVATRHAADVVVTWFGQEALAGLPPSEAHKAYLAGPSTHPTLEITTPAAKAGPGLVDVTVPGSAAEAARPLADFLSEAKAAGIALDVRSTPSSSGPGSAESGDHAFGIVSPSAQLLDLLLAGTPVAAWSLPMTQRLAMTNHGLFCVGTADDCWRFAWRAIHRPEQILAHQADFLDWLAIPRDVEQRYGTLLAALPH